MAISRRQVPPHLYERYGVRSRGRELAAVAAVTLSVIGAAVAFLVVARGMGSGGDTKLVKWSIGPSAINITWSVQRYDNASVVCVLRAQDADRFDVGYAVVKVANTAENQQIDSQLRVRAAAYSVVPPDCELAASQLLPPNFRPGLLPPAQQPPLAAPWQPLPAAIGS